MAEHQLSITRTLLVNHISLLLGPLYAAFLFGCKDMAKKARVLMTVIIDGYKFEPNQVIEASVTKIKALGDAVDASPDAVKYCIEQLGQEAISIGSDEMGPHKPDPDPDAA